MKGKRIFNAKTANEIKSMLIECHIAGRYDNMNIRGNLRRKYNFFISDFDRKRKGFTAEDFDHYVSNGEILIVEDSYVNLLKDLSNFHFESKTFLKRIEVLAQRINDETGISTEDREELLLSLDILK